MNIILLVVLYIMLLTLVLKVVYDLKCIIRLITRMNIPKGSGGKLGLLSLKYE